MDKELERIDGLYAKIKSGYYLKNKNGQVINSINKKIVYEYLKAYITQHKSDSDIIIYNDQQMQIIINTVDKTLSLDRYVHINKQVVNIDDLNSNLGKFN